MYESGAVDRGRYTGFMLRTDHTKAADKFSGCSHLIEHARHLRYERSSLV